LGSFGLTEILILFVIVVFLFGAKRIPDLFSAVGKSIKGFKKEINKGKEDDVSNP